MSAELIANMRERVERCRRLAFSILDKPASEALLKMAAEIEADVMKLEAEESGPLNQMPPPTQT